VRIPGVAAGLVLQKIDGQLYAIRDDVRPTPGHAAGGPFSTDEDARLWLIEQQEAKLTPEQLTLWTRAHDALTTYTKSHALNGMVWRETDRLGALYFIIGAIRKGVMRVDGIPETPEQFEKRIFKYCAGPLWRQHAETV